MALPYYVYELRNSLTGDVFYVGKGKGSRMYVHEKEAKNGKACKKSHYIREILRSGGQIEAKAVETFKDEADAYRAEKELIEVYGLQNLVNIVSGGVLSPSAIAAIKDRKEKARLIARQREIDSWVKTEGFIRQARQITRDCKLDLYWEWAGKFICDARQAFKWLVEAVELSSDPQSVYSSIGPEFIEVRKLRGL